MTAIRPILSGRSVFPPRQPVRFSAMPKSLGYVAAALLGGAAAFSVQKAPGLVQNAPARETALAPADPQQIVWKKMSGKIHLVYGFREASLKFKDEKTGKSYTLLDDNNPRIQETLSTLNPDDTLSITARIEPDRTHVALVEDIRNLRQIANP